MQRKRVTMGVLAALLLSFCLLSALPADDTTADQSFTLGDQTLNDGTILSNDGKRLISASADAVDYRIPDGVEVIAAYAFFNCADLRSITFPGSVTTLEPHAFDGTRIITVYVPYDAPYLSGIPSFYTIIKTGLPSFTVSFNTDGGSSVAAQTVNAGEKATKPTDPTKSGYVFAGWYSDVSLMTAYNFNDAVNANLTLYAKWVAELVFTSVPTADMIIKQKSLNTFVFTPKVKNASVVTWDFGDGTKLQGSANDPVTYTYTENGTYKVSLTASNDQGSVTTEKTITAGEDNNLDNGSTFDKLSENPALIMIIIAAIVLIAACIWKWYS